MAEPYKHVYRVDLNEPLKRFDVGEILASGDEKANSFEVAVESEGKSVDLAGCTVYGYFIRPNEETMKVNGTVEGNWARVELSKSCYVYDGAFSLAIKITGNGITQTVAVFDGLIVRTTSENIVDGNRVIYGLEDLLAQIAATEAAAVNANTAASNANTATATATTAANNANKWSNAEANATAISAEKQPTVVVSETGGKKVISFGIPAGKTPNITFRVATGEPGTQVQIQQSGTPEAPVIDLTIPRGDTGAVDGIDYYAGSPSKLGTASPGTANGVARGDHVHPMPSASDIGALAAGGTAADSSKLGGKTPEYYIQPYNLLDNSDFTNPVNQRGQTSYAGAVYGIDRWKSFSDGAVVTVGNDGVEFTGANFAQIVPVTVLKTGQMYTFAAKQTDGTIRVATGTYPMSEALIQDGLTLKLDGLASQYAAITTAGVYEWAALYEGEYTPETLPPYAHKGYAAELAECQRYFVRIGGNAAYTHIGLAHAQNDTQLICSAHLPQPMRQGVSPSVVRGGTLNMTAKAGTTFKDVSAVALNQMGVGAIALTLTSSGLTKGGVFDVYVPTGSWLDLSADL